MPETDFYCVRDGRPFLNINAIILRPENEMPLPKKIPVETKPLYSGTLTRIVTRFESMLFMASKEVGELRYYGYTMNE